jgi:hypothetical protein
MSYRPPIGDASTTKKGIVQLTGDFGGTASSPTVPSLANKANTSHTHPIADVTNLQTALDGKTSIVVNPSSTVGLPDGTLIAYTI